MKQFKITKGDGYHYISSTSRSVSNKYLIRCEDLEEAKKIELKLLNGTLKEPYLNDNGWTKVGSHFIKKIPIYTIAYVP